MKCIYDVLYVFIIHTYIYNENAHSSNIRIIMGRVTFHETR